MPELPDLEHYKNNLSAAIVGPVIASAEIHFGKKCNCSPTEFSDALKGSRFSNITRVGKELVFHVENGQSFAVHLMLFGGFVLSSEAKIGKGTVFVIQLEDGQIFSMTDNMKMAKTTLNPGMPSIPDALGDTFTEAYFLNGLQKRKKSIKAVLIDQKFVLGIGNAYADEILWHARIHPESAALAIPEPSAKSLYKSIADTLTNGVRQLESHTPGAISGEYRGFMEVHLPKKETTSTGFPIQKTTVAKKKTYWTEEQELFLP